MLDSLPRLIIWFFALVLTLPLPLLELARKRDPRYLATAFRRAAWASFIGFLLASALIWTAP